MSALSMSESMQHIPSRDVKAKKFYILSFFKFELYDIIDFGNKCCNSSYKIEISS